MAIYQGDKKIVDRYVGETLVTRTYQGDKLIFDAYSELSGTLPLTVRSRASQVLKNYRVYGESVQDGTPTPDNPVEVTGLGVRTVNLFDKDTYLVGGTLAPVATWDCYNVIIRLKANTTYVMSSDVPYVANYNHLYVYSANYANPYQIIYRNHPAEVTTGEDGCIYFQYATRAYYNQLLDGTYYVTLTEGSAAIPYEPYGYKLPIKVTSNSTDTVTTPVYIGVEPLHRIAGSADRVDYSSGKIVRWIKKVVLTGEEVWYTETAYDYGRVFKTVVLPSGDTRSWVSVISTHYSSNKLILSWGANRMLFIADDRFGSSISDFKTFLADQYTAGTPVTVWYIMNTPVEEDPPVPFPDITLPQGTVTIDIDGALKPQATVKGRINPTV